MSPQWHHKNVVVMFLENEYIWDVDYELSVGLYTRTDAKTAR